MVLLHAGGWYFPPRAARLFAHLGPAGGQGKRVLWYGRETRKGSELRANQVSQRILTVAGVLLVGALCLATACGSDSEPGKTPATPAATPTRALSAKPHEPGTFVETMSSGGMERGYRLHVPPSYDGSTPTALVVCVHGLRSNALQQERYSRFSEKADEEGFVVVYPEGSGALHGWNSAPAAREFLGGPGADDVLFISELITRLEGELCIDSGRIYATGISNGGGMAYRLGCELSGRIAAIGPVAGAYFPLASCDVSRPVPAVAFHGTADPLVPYEGTRLLRVMPAIEDWAAQWAQRDGCDADPEVFLRKGDVTARRWDGCDDGAEVELYTVDGGGHTWPGAPKLPGAKTTDEVDATDVIWDFFEEHPLR